MRNQFKKNLAVMTAAMNKANVDLGRRTLCYYKPGGSQDNSECQKFFEQMMSNLNVMKTCKGHAKADGCIPDPYMQEYITYSYASGFHKDKIENTCWVYDLADGTIVILYSYGISPLFFVDVNGSKGPNQIGKDILRLHIYSDGDDILKFSGSSLNYGMPGAYFTNLTDIYGE